MFHFFAFIRLKITVLWGCKYFLVCLFSVDVHCACCDCDDAVISATWKPRGRSQPITNILSNSPRDTTWESYPHALHCLLTLSAVSSELHCTWLERLKTDNHGCKISASLSSGRPLDCHQFVSLFGFSKPYLFQITIICQLRSST